MRSLLRRLIVWATRPPEIEISRPSTVAVSDSSSPPSVRLSVLAAMNGKILQIDTYKPNPHGPDWTSKLFIVPPDQTLSQAITTVLIMSNIEQ